MVTNDIEIGTRFGKLVVVEQVRNQGRIYYNCKCDCGITKAIYKHSLLRGKSSSCGCQEYVRKSKFNKSIPGFRQMKSSHHNMLQRCRNPKHHNFEYYGGRGITVCERWLSFSNFMEDMSATWFEGAEIDRINVNGNYEPLNCKWATRKEQMTNRRTSLPKLIYEGKEWSIKELADHCNMHVNTFYNRISRGWTLTDAILKPVNKK